METNLYHYNAQIVDIYDGDTCKADIDLGLATWVHRETLRLSRINAPEVRGAERIYGLKSRDFLRDKILNKEVIVQTVKDRKGKYGRYLAEIWVHMEPGGWTNVNDLMVQEGFAVYKDYD